MKQPVHLPSARAAAPVRRSSLSTTGRRRRMALAALAAATCTTLGFAQTREIDQRSRYTAAKDQTFSQYIAGRMPDWAYSFGSSAAVPWAHNGYAIRSLADLQAHFNPLQDFTGPTTINGELQVYAPVFNPVDHRLGSDRLGLWANLPGQQWTVRVGAQSNQRLGWPLDGSLIAWDRIPAMLQPYASEWRAGQFVALHNRGIYYIAEIQPGVGLRLAPLQGSPASGEFLYNLIAMLPIDSATSIAPADRSTAVLSFAPGALSPTVRPGHRVALTVPDSVVRNAGDVFVTAVDHAAGLVLLNRPMPLDRIAAGQRYVFYPRITAGQAWTRQQWNISHPNAFFAVEFEIGLFEGLSPSFESSGISSSASFVRADQTYPDAPFGAWPALWAYSADDGDASYKGSASEMDFMELWVSPNSGMKLFSTVNVGGDPVWTRTGAGYTTSGNGRNRVPYSLAGRHKVAIVYAGRKTYHYLNDMLIRIEQYRWTSQAPLQIGMNFAMGSVNRNFAVNLNVPFRPENFQRAHMDIRNLRIWHRAQ